MALNSHRGLGTHVSVIVYISWISHHMLLILHCLCFTRLILSCICWSMFDDIAIVSSSSKATQCLLQQLSASFPVKDLGPLNYFLGIKVASNSGGMVLTQRKYAQDILRRVHMENCKLVTTPLCVTDKLSKHSGVALCEKDAFTARSSSEATFKVGGANAPPPGNQNSCMEQCRTVMNNVTTLLQCTPAFALASPQYQSIVGALQYLALTRTDLAFAVNKVCQFLSAPTNVH
jgi:hypothetical protein